MTQSQVTSKVQQLAPVVTVLKHAQELLREYENTIGLDNFVVGLREHVTLSTNLAINLIAYIKNFPVSDNKNNG